MTYNIAHCLSDFDNLPVLSGRLLPILLAVTSLVAYAQNKPIRSEAPRKSVQIQRLDLPSIKIDGNLTEPAWQRIAPITDFIQTTPDLGQPVSERTEVRIFYDENNIYFGFTCFDREPEKIVARLGAHDGVTGSDSVNIFIDTFHDRRTGYFFSINSRGIQFDALANEGRGDGFESYDETWDGIWHSAATLHDWGYSVEVAIPFKSIRISSAANQDWGMNVSRDIVRKNESAYWVPVTRFDGVMKPSKAGDMTGLESVRVGRNLEVIPFFSTGYRRASWTPELDGAKGTAGVDVRYGLTANLTAVGTLNPDFADTEADEFTAQISRFEIFFPEKRKFFTEGANYFETPMKLFFSRRIGSVLPNGEPQRILEGGKITGQSGSWTIGALQALTQEETYVDPQDGQQKIAPGGFFGVMRVQRKIFEKSAVGLISVNRMQKPGSVGQRESSHGVDLHLLKGENTNWNSQFMVNLNSANPGVDWQHVGFQSEFEYNTESFEYETGAKLLGRKTDLSHTGFEPEVDRWSGWMGAEYKPFINRFGIRQIFTGVNYDEANNTSGALEDSGADVWTYAQLKNFWTVRFEHRYDRVRYNQFTSDFQPVDCATRTSLCPTRIYTTPQWKFELETNRNRAVYLLFRHEWGKTAQFEEFFYGHHKTYELRSNIRLGGKARLEAGAVRVREWLHTGQFYQNRDYLISRLTYQFTPKMRARVLTQYFQDRHGHNVSVNSLFAYDFTARSALFVGYNRQKNSPLDRSALGDYFYIKTSYLFGF
ncbi:MAG TPA: DUF5916 domain-containing protein [Terriglobales bacterium]|nr:DUF5916 domain-containing protein [Terriglobales bacterium]